MKPDCEVWNVNEVCSPNESRDRSRDQYEAHETFTGSSRKDTVIRQQLETWSCAILEDQGNAKDFKSTTEHMAPFFQARIDVLPIAISREQHIEALRAHFKRLPNFGIEIINVSTDLHASSGVADVFLCSRMTGLEFEFEREAVAILRWQRQRGLWTCVKYVTMRGSAGFATV
ncbi:hypothetical protein LTR86_010370 [Recurvomyces mirabilis]|nr:hypothetical protein LTR86_010370 [Recurvomyces mirabilis]